MCEQCFSPYVVFAWHAQVVVAINQMQMALQNGLCVHPTRRQRYLFWLPCHIGQAEKREKRRMCAWMYVLNCTAMHHQCVGRSKTDKNMCFTLKCSHGKVATAAMGTMCSTCNTHSVPPSLIQAMGLCLRSWRRRRALVRRERRVGDCVDVQTRTINWNGGMLICTCPRTTMATSNELNA